MNHVEACQYGLSSLLRMLQHITCKPYTTCRTCHVNAIVLTVVTSDVKSHERHGSLINVGMLFRLRLCSLCQSGPGKERLPWSGRIAFIACGSS